MSPTDFRPLTSRRRSSLIEQWSADVHPASQATGVGLDLDAPLLEDAGGRGPGSSALAAIFEELPIEWVTGEPAVESRRFEVGDGLEILSQEPLKSLDEAATAGPTGVSVSEMGAPLAGDLARSEEIIGFVGRDAESGSDEVESVTHEQQQAGYSTGDVGPEQSEQADQGDSDSALESDFGRHADSLENDLVPPPAPEPVQIGIAEAEHLAAVEAARAAGREEGIAEARKKLEAEVVAQQKALADMIESIQVAASDSQRLFEPLKRLSMHLAQQLVRGELSLSGESINRLVDQCLLEIDQRASREVTLALHPDDAERWRRRAPVALESVTLRPDPALSIGSVRVSSGESVIEDLIEHRLQHLANRLLGDGGARGLPRMTPLHLQIGADEDISDAG